MDIDFKKIEEKWQARWEKDGAFEASDKSKLPKYYVLEMFPYPSGTGLHMGHAWNYTIGDIISRYKKMLGFNVLHPMGYDALGLPAENAAIKAGIHPKEYNQESIKNFTRQMKEIGLSYDWSRTLSTDDPGYYKWDQWIFLKMFEKGLAYQKESSVNWCPKCETVLANEQVVGGKCWRHDGMEVETKKLKQWFLKITDYADELYEEIDKLKDWPDRTRAMQKNWIGKSHGFEIGFEVEGKKWPIFTTRPDTLYGVTFMVVAANHPKLDSLVKKGQEKEVSKFLKKIKSASQKDIEKLEKEGVFTGSYAANPATGEKIPVYAGNFVLAEYGSGMVMGVPAHDKRDYAFAKKYDISIKQVIEGDISKAAYTGVGKMINSGEFDGLNSKDAIGKIGKKFGKKVTNFRLRDWGISRQRYWGTPIPIIHCEGCGAVAVSEKDLPINLPVDVKFGKGNPLETNEEWLSVKCPKCKGDAKRESDTMDTFVNSSWYFLRYTDPKNRKAIFDKEKVNLWCPVDTYIGGAEHACMHLIYFRFYTKFLADLGLLKFREPANRLFHQGMLHAEGGQKMSKSKPETVVLPEDVSIKYGMDTARFFLSSLASPDKNIDWSEKGIIGSLRFIKKLFLHFERGGGKDKEKVLGKLNKTIQNVSEYYENFEYRKATIEIRELFDLMDKEGSSKSTRDKFLKILNPICPHITEELNEKMGGKKTLASSNWPKADIVKEGKEKVDLNGRIIDQLKPIVEKYGDKEKIYLYVIPNDYDKIDQKVINDNFKKEIKVYSVKDTDKYDPENKAKKALPGKPGVYLE